MDTLTVLPLFVSLSHQTQSTPKMNFINRKEFMEYSCEDNLVVGESGSRVDVSTYMPNGRNESEVFSYVFDNGTTPVKECGDLVYNGGRISDSYTENKTKEGLQRESMLQVKRRRMLQFEPEVLDSPFCYEEIPPEFLGSEETDDSLDMDISEISQWASSFTESTSALCNEVLDLSSGEWVAECFNDQEMYSSVDEIGNKNTPVTPDSQVTTELGSNPLLEAKVVPDQPLYTHQNVVFKGRKSYMRNPSKLPVSVAYPFDFIKPCGINGDVTLEDINQKISKPKPKPKQREDHSARFPKSTLTGKPVVGKTKLLTEGGTGSITIMRTRG